MASIIAVITMAAAQPVAAAVGPEDLVHVQVDHPRAFGHVVGDVVQRHIVVDAPRGSTLDADSLPRPARSGQALELREVRWRDVSGLAPGARARFEIDLTYQVFLAPQAVRTLEMPPFLLRVRSGERVQEARVEAWPVSAGPLTPADASVREGLGELRPDDPPPPTASPRAPWRLTVYAVIAAAAALYLAWTLWGLPWQRQRDRPFQRAWRELRRLATQSGRGPRRDAMQRLHHALNESAGRVLFERDLAAFMARDARYAPLANDLASFFAHSRREFFDDLEAPVDGGWLRQLARRLRDAERGTA